MIIEYIEPDESTTGPSDLDRVSAEHDRLQREYEDTMKRVEEEAKKRQADEEAARQRAREEAAELLKKQQEEAEKLKHEQEAAEMERKRQEAAEIERKRQEAAAMERKRQEAAEMERKRQEAAEMERKRQEAAESERKRQEAAEAEKIVAEEEARRLSMQRQTSEAGMKRSFSPTRHSNPSRMDLSPLSFQLKIAQEEEEQLKREEAAKKDAAAAIQTVRRLTRNPNKCTFEILQQWRMGGDERKAVVKEYMAAGQDVTKVTVNLILRDVLSEQLPCNMQEKKMKEKLTEEQVYKHYEPNQVKAKEAIEFAVAEGRRDLSYENDPNFPDHAGYRLYKIFTGFSETQIFEKRREIEANIKPLCQDQRPAAQALLIEL
eukprot:s5787_g2.t2